LEANSLAFANQGAPFVLAHHVYFALKDPSEANIAHLIAACRKYLTGHAGTVFFACGTRAKELARPVNDLEFDVGLHIIFDSQASHDAYQVAHRHEQFVAENQASWKKVRVFDSSVEGERGA
jgi:hypothetical protein